MAESVVPKLEDNDEEVIAKAMESLLSSSAKVPWDWRARNCTNILMNRRLLRLVLGELPLSQVKLVQKRIVGALADVQGKADAELALEREIEKQRRDVFFGEMKKGRKKLGFPQT